LSKDNLKDRDVRLIIFALGRLHALYGLLGYSHMGGENEFSKDEIVRLAEKLGAKIE
jgi:hypothetical protein